MIFNYDDIAAAFSARAFEEGRRWFEAGWVHAPNVQRQGALVTASLTVGGRAPLRVYIRVEKSARRVKITPECTCRQRRTVDTRGYCEHAAAVLLQALADEDSAGAEIHASKAADKDRRQDFTLLYSLDVDPEGIAVDARSANRLSDGHFRAGASFDPARLTRRMRPRFLTQEDVAVLERLQQLPRNSAGHTLLTDASAAALLPALLATERVFWTFDSRPTSAPLRPGSPRALQLHWLTDAFGIQSLSVGSDPGADTLLPASPPWYLDLDTGECGPCDTPLPAAALQRLLASPHVLPHEAQRLRSELMDASPDPAPALPELYPIELISSSAMVPVATLLGRPFPHLELSFDYGGIRFPCGAPNTQLIDGRVIEVDRDEAAEQGATERLVASGFSIAETPSQAGTPSPRWVVGRRADPGGCA